MRNPRMKFRTLEDKIEVPETERGQFPIPHIAATTPQGRGLSPDLVKRELHLRHRAQWCCSSHAQCLENRALTPIPDSPTLNNFLPLGSNGFRISSITATIPAGNACVVGTRRIFYFKQFVHSVKEGRCSRWNQPVGRTVRSLINL